MEEAEEMAQKVIKMVVDKISEELQREGFEEASKYLDCKYDL